MVERRVLRTLFRITAVAVVSVIVFAALTAVVLHLYGARRLEQARADFDARWGRLARYEPPAAVPDHLNGARWLSIGGAAIVTTLDDRQLYTDLSGRPARTWTDAERAEARRILGQQRDALEVLVRSGDFSSFVLGTDGSRAVYEEVDFLSLVKGLRLLTLEARLAWTEGRTEDALAALRAVGHAVDGLLQTPIVMTTTIGAAAERWAAGAAADIVVDPCATPETLIALGAALPTRDPADWGTITLAVSVAEIADEGLAYIDDFHDPSLGWSLPFWIANHYLLEDLFVAEALERWIHHIELGQIPALQWPAGAVETVWGEPAWTSWFALTGTFTPNLVSARAREQAASARMQQLRLALELRLASPTGLDVSSCDLADWSAPTALTGGPVSCGVDPQRTLLVVEVPGAADALREHVMADNQAARIPPIELPIGDRRQLCRRADGEDRPVSSGPAGRGW